MVAKASGDGIERAVIINEFVQAVRDLDEERREITERMITAEKRLFEAVVKYILPKEGERLTTRSGRMYRVVRWEQSRMWDRFAAVVQQLVRPDTWGKEKTIPLYGLRDPRIERARELLQWEQRV